MIGGRRAEMRAIRDAIKAYATPGTRLTGAIVECVRLIAEQLRAMKHLWVGKGLDGLIKRREAEAQLVEEAIDPVT